MGTIRGFVVLFSIGLALAPGTARPCAAFAGHPVELAEEDALIVWDGDRKLQHFVRRARFSTASADVAFLVPTPAVPELAEADEAVFERLAALSLPKRVTQTEVSFMPLSCGLLMLGMVGSADPSGAMPQVLQTVRVGSYEASTLEADDEGALSQWLESNGYALPDHVRPWLAHYVAKGWFITAFKLARSEGAEKLATKAVRLSFATELPFYPYLEPEAAAADAERRELFINDTSRWMRLWVVSDARVEGRLREGWRPWSARVLSAVRTPAGPLLAGAVPVDEGERWVTAFFDPASSRPASDLEFVPAVRQEPVHPPPIVSTDTIPVPADLLLLILGVGAVLTVRRRRRK